MKKHWWPPWAYETRPWAALVSGATAGAAALALAIVHGSWGVGTTLMFGASCVLCIYGAVILQLRREYRRTSKWQRRNPE